MSNGLRAKTKEDWAKIREELKDFLGDRRCMDPCEICGLGDGIHLAGCPNAGQTHTMFYVDEATA